MSKVSTDTDSTNRTRTSLLRRLKDWEDKASWQRFFDTYWKLIYHVAIKSGLTEAEAQDVVQETMVTVARNIKDFEYNRSTGSFRGWLLKTTRWRIADQFRKRLPASKSPPRPAGETQRTATIERIPDPAGADLDAIWETEWQKNLMEAALARVKRKVDAKQYEVFDLYANKGMSVGDVAHAQGVSVGYVYLTKHRVAALLKKEVARLEKNPV